MIVTAWKNGKFSSPKTTYGIKIDPDDRDRFFKREWQNVLLQFEGLPFSIEVNIAKQSFWGDTCRELINAEIGFWLNRNGLVPWPKSKPPKLILEPLGGRKFWLKARE
jgi:hypothetical protein